MSDEVVHKTLNIKFKLRNPEIFKYAKDGDAIECYDEDNKIIRKFLKSFLTLVIVPKDKEEKKEKVKKVEKIKEAPVPKELKDAEELTDVESRSSEEDDNEI